MLCILQVAQMWSYWSNSRGTAPYRGKSGLLAPLGISVRMCSPFWNPPSIPSAPSLLASGKAKHLHCTCLCAHQSSPGVPICVSGVAGFIILFCSFSLTSRVTKGKLLQNYNQEYLILFTSFPLRGGTFLSLLKGRELPLSPLPLTATPFYALFCQKVKVWVKGAGGVGATTKSPAGNLLSCQFMVIWLAQKELESF